MTNIILCGGSGTRLWPLSRRFMPKQFLKLFNKKSLFQLTIERNKDIAKVEIISNEDQYFLALDQIEEVNLDNVKFFLEEVGKNTAPAVALVALESKADDILFITPSDHLIKNKKEYYKTIEKGKKLAQQGYIVTFGIKPTNPNTGYGYIESNGEDVISFHEKPDEKTAEGYLKKGNFYWNSGMFMFKARVFLEELKKHSPKLYEEVLKVEREKASNNLIRIKNMSNLQDISIDYAVMEKSDKIKVVKAEFEWNDVGSFDSLINEVDSRKAIEIESKKNFYYSDNNKKIISTIGVGDLIIIDTNDALLISKKGQTQEVKKIVDILKKIKKEITQTHSQVHRPWGTYETILEDSGYKIKRIIVKPGKRLSLQKHFHRNEHWIVVSGTAEVQIGDRVFLVRPNESTYIKMGEVHRLSNPGKVPVVLIEAQVGEYTDEDDIIRIEDDFKRKV